MIEEKMPADLSRPEAYKHRPSEVRLLQTHISWVFLAGDLVYKVKKPVNYEFLDFTTLDKRRYYCHEEVRLNRRLAPDIYLGVVKVVKDKAGRHVMEGRGPAVDYAVKMKRLPEDEMMLAKLGRGEVETETIDRIVPILFNFYQKATTGASVDECGRLEYIKNMTDQNFFQTIDYLDVALSQHRFEIVRSYTDKFYQDNAGLFERRLKGGFIRDGHGDLHMENICLGEKVWIFDCVEFNECFRYSDVASDLSFLAMDLDYRGRPDLSRYLIDAYIGLSGDKELICLLTFYKCYRAYVRGKVNCLAFDRPEVKTSDRDQALEEARSYFDLAYSYAGGRQRPQVLVFFGLTGTGKTHWAEAAGRRTGAPVISSDRVRKKMAGKLPQERVYAPFGQGIYSEEMTEAVYQNMREAARKLAGSGQDVILEATYSKSAHRRALVDALSGEGADITFIQIHAAEDAVMTRLKEREAAATSVSDGRGEIYFRQAEKFDPVQPLPLARWIDLDATGAEDKVAEKLWEVLGL